MLLACVADEEGVSIGSEDLVKRHTMDACIVIEPDELPKAIVEHQGFGWIDVIVHGVAAHGSAPEKGVDAIVHMAEVVQRMDRIDRDVFSKTADSRNGKTVFHTGTLAGGDGLRDVPVARGARHRDRHAAGRAPERPRPRDRGDLRRAVGHLARVLRARST